jgi:ABC-type uncharacterized transport system involved in gliding motility auxiliary subunit
MNQISKICFLMAGISAVALGVFYSILMVWMPIFYFFVFVIAICLGATLLLDWRTYLEFFTLKTTKHGMNMGALILLTLAALICINYLGVRYNKTWDVTAEKIYSLSEQTKKILSALKDDLEIKVFYRGPAAGTEKTQVQKTLEIFNGYSSKVKVRYYNSYVDKAEATEYLASLPDEKKANVFAFVEYQGKRIRVESPFDENQFVRAIVKATHRGEKKVYFLTGHGERELDSTNPEGLSFFKEALEGQAFKVESLNLLEKNEIPKDADFLVIAGPKSAYVPQELVLLKAYVTAGGRLFIAIDPGQRQNLAGFLREYGVEFMNNYAISLDRGKASGLAIGIEFSPTSPVTQDFMVGQKNAYVLFDMASEIKPSASIPNGLKVDQIVRSTPLSFALDDLKHQVQVESSQLHSVTLAVEVKGRLDHNKDGSATETNAASEKDKVFEALVFGDSDFISNQGLFLGLNRDLALNASSELAHETDLIGTRAKSYKGTVLDVGRYQFVVILLAAVALPLLLFITSLMVWFRRRGA